MRLVSEIHPQIEAPPVDVRVAVGGATAFPLILGRIAEARETIDVRAYVWRDDQTGRAVARALLDAADRGVAVSIFKDRDAASYEYYEHEGRSLFHDQLRLYDHVESNFLSFSYEGRPVRRRRGPNALRRALLAHPGISVRHEERRFDHAKVYVFDGERIILGGMNVGDDAHHHVFDFMVELTGEAIVQRYRERKSGRAAYDPTRRVDFLLHDRAAHGIGRSAMRGDRLALLDAARESLFIEMAYFGDHGFHEAIARAVKRGVRTTVMTARRAAILRHLNQGALDDLLRRTGSPENLEVVLLPHDVHSKVVIIDDRVVDVGSANFTQLSHGFYDELNVCLRDRFVARSVREALDSHRAQGERITGRLRHNRLFAHIETMLMDRHARGARS